MAVRSTLLFLAALLFATPIQADNASQTPSITVAKISESEQNMLQRNKLDVSHELLVKENYRYYEVDGDCASDVLKQMKQKGTKWNDGKVYAALTTWDIRYNYDVAEENGRYSLTSITTDVDIVFHMPRRTNASVVDPFGKMWQAYYDSLMEHEFGHRDLAVRAASKINRSLASLGSFDNSNELEKQAKAVVRAELKRLREVQIHYDDETRHGETQGAILH